MAMVGQEGGAGRPSSIALLLRQERTNGNAWWAREVGRASGIAL
jgi:hypothetical protein